MSIYFKSPDVFFYPSQKGPG